MKISNLKFKRKPDKVWIMVLFVYLTWLISNSSYSQFNINFESARNLPKKNIELLGSFSSVSYSYKGECDHILNAVGSKVGVGITDILDLKLSYSHLFSGNIDEINNISLFPKISTRGQIFAVTVPFGFYFRSEYEPIWYIAPGLLFTVKYKKVFEATLSPNVYIQFDDDDEFWVGLNLGLGISSNLDVWSIRPEVGLMQTAFDKGIYWNLGLSLAYIMDFKNKKINKL